MPLPFEVNFDLSRVSSLQKLINWDDYEVRIWATTNHFKAAEYVDGELFLCNIMWIMGFLIIPDL